MLVERNFVHLSPDQVSFYDETLKKQIEGSYRDDGKKIYVMHQVYGARSAPRGGCFDHYEVKLLAQKVLGELALDAESKLARDAEKATAKPHSLKKAA
jgi:hypothetical protein